MDRSLIFFYSFIGLVFTLFFIQLLRDPLRWQGLGWLASLLISMFFSALFFSFGSGVWLISSVAISIVVPAIILFIVYNRRRRAIKKRLIQTVEAILREGIASLSERLASPGSSEWRKKEWYILNSPFHNTFEIGMNPWHLTPVINEKFHLLLLSGRMFSFRPDYITPMDDINIEMVCRLADFYAFSEESKKRVTDYITAIQNNVADPWRMVSPEQEDKPQP